MLFGIDSIKKCMYLHLIINKKLFFNQNYIFNKLFVNNSIYLWIFYLKLLFIKLIRNFN